MTLLFVKNLDFVWGENTAPVVVQGPATSNILIFLRRKKKR